MHTNTAPLSIPPPHRQGLLTLAFSFLLLAVLGWMRPNAVYAQECNAPGSGIPSEIDFSVDGNGNPLNAGDVNDSNTWSGIDISIIGTTPPGLSLMIFDTENPTGNDFDLGTPNQDFGGPGVGAAGGLGQPGENNVGLGNALIISEDGDSSDPDDDGDGGIMIFIFDEAVEVRQIQTLDADDNSPGVVRLYDDPAGGAANLIATFTGVAYGENSFELIDITTLGVRRLEFELDGSGTMDKLVLCGDDDGDGTFGDTVFHDVDGNGVQDPGDLGIANVKVYLRNNESVVIDSLTTDANGNYDFTDLIAAEYTADVVESTLPAGVSLTTGNEPDTHTLATNEDYNDADFGYNGGSLPVELTLFKALVDGPDVLLAWETASETNNAGFDVQHFNDLQPWQSLGWVDGHGTTELARSYTYRVENLEPGRHRFRLKQIDFDGTFEYHAEVEVLVEMVERFVIEPVYPNPFNPEAQFRFAVQRSQAVRVALYDLLGRQVKVLYDGVAASGQMQAVRIDGSVLPSGLYLVRVAGTSFVDTQTVTLLK